MFLRASCHPVILGLKSHENHLQEETGQSAGQLCRPPPRESVPCAWDGLFKGPTRPVSLIV
jgi:hypothetical protein